MSEEPDMIEQAIYHAAEAWGHAEEGEYLAEYVVICSWSKVDEPERVHYSLYRQERPTPAHHIHGLINVGHELVDYDEDGD